MSPSGLTAERKLEALRHALGPDVVAALYDPQVVEILANADGRLILDLSGEGRRDTGVRLSADSRGRVVRLVADHMGEVANRGAPRLAGVLPGGERFQGMLPPISPQPAFAIRKRPAVIHRLADYVRAGTLREDQAEHLRTAVRERRNILICGGAGSGKTTLANAVLAEPAFTGDRVILIEDTPELQCSAWDLAPLITCRDPASVGVVDLVRDALRLRPDRIVVGEMRDGAAVLETLKAGNTGHPGGLSTLHANSAREAISRLEDLLGEVSARRSGRLIAQAVDRIVHIRRHASGRTVDEILGVALAPSGQLSLTPLG